jgi:hypothetical protein
MRRLLKFSALLCVLLFTFSILGCASNDSSQKETKNEVKTKVATQTQQTVAKAETKKTQTQTPVKATASVSTERKEKTPVQTNINSESTKKVQTYTSTSETSTSTSSHKNTAQATAKPATTATTTVTTTTVSPKPKPSTPPPPQKPAETVTLSIVGPKDRGTIIGATKVSFKDGQTIFDILLQETKKHKIIVDSRGSGATAYIEGIDNYYEFDYGAKSGWVFKLNGVSLTKSIGAIKVKDGDRIECYYTE